MPNQPGSRVPPQEEGQDRFDLAQQPGSVCRAAFDQPVRRPITDIRPYAVRHGPSDRRLVVRPFPFRRRLQHHFEQIGIRQFVAFGVTQALDLEPAGVARRQMRVDPAACSRVALACMVPD
jgi:hypothetical protein